MLGETLAHYRILEKLGSGGMGDVYKAEDLTLHRLVALKLLRGPAPDEGRERLLFEARAASALNHPGIATIYEAGDVSRDGGVASYIAMEYVDGRMLTEAAKGRDVVEILDLVCEVAGALDGAHRQGVVHRDVKPGNVLVTDDGRVKLLDFRLAQVCSRTDDQAVTWSRPGASLSGELVGTVAYMSPEQALGRDVDRRTDVFSLGVVLYELVTGRRPFVGDTPMATLDAILHAEPEPLTRTDGEAPPVPWPSWASRT